MPQCPNLARLLALAVFVAVPCSQAQASWPHDPNNGNVALCTATGSQYNPTIVSDGAGGAIVTWHDFRGGANAHIYTQRVSSAGVALWTADGVALCTAANNQYDPMIVSDGAGGAIVTWHDSRNGTNYDIYAQRVNAAGAPQWPANGVALCTAASDQQFTTIASDGAGGAIVTWQDFRSGTANHIYAQRVNAAGVPQWAANGVALCTAANDQLLPTIVSDGSGGAIVAWYDYRSGTNYDVYAQRVNASGVPQWTANGVALCTAANSQYLPTVVSDGSGGAIVTWQDERSGSSDVYAQRVNAAGLPLWAVNGVALSTAIGSQQGPTITSDGSGGAIVTWYDSRSGADYDIYAQRVTAAGTPQWTADGVPLCTAAYNQVYSNVTSDGAGGAIVTWHDLRSGTNYDVYAQRVTATGGVLWTWNGVAVSTAVSDQAYPTIVSDGTGGAIITWQDYRNFTGNDIYAQRIERYGYLGNPEPTIVRVKDVPNDQGGFVKVGWNASYLDVDPTAGIYEYRVWRSAPPNLAMGAVRVRGVTSDPDEAARTGRFLRLPASATDYLWELVGRQQAFELSGYSMVAATTSDSVAAGNPRTAFMVEAGTSNYTGSPHWFSVPDSGYSVDNLGPATPAPFTGAYLAGATQLHWGANSEIDLAGYRLYRGSSAGFIPGPGNLISAQPDTGHADPGPAGSYYKLSAVDIHGNESPYALLSPSGTSDVGGGEGPRVLALATPKPNPAVEGALLSFTVPEAQQVTLAIYDPAGRRVRTVLSGPMDPGAYDVPFDLRDQSGRLLGAGLYFIRLEAAGKRIVRRLAIID
jgi:hypothetical protein